MDKIFEIGSWVSTEDGYGQVLFNRQLYIEEFTLATKSGKKGELERVMYICKVLCGFEGKIKSRFLVKNYTSVQELSKKEEKLVQKIKAENPEGYKNYITEEGKEVLMRQVFLTYKVDDNQVDEVLEKINTINRQLKPSFTFKEFAKEFKKNDMPFSYQDFHKKGQSYNRSEVVSLRFDSFLYATKKKESVFNNVVAIKI